MSRPVRTRFAPSPTGGLHLGGVRTALYSYLYAKHHKGSFILRIEDTDQQRYVEGAEQYILQCLQWCGIEPDEGPHKPGHYGPYRQSERKKTYHQYAHQLIESGHAYYAFDTPAELDAMRERFRSDMNPLPQYDARTRMQMRNSLALSEASVKQLLQDGVPYVIRLRMPDHEQITFTDLIRGEIKNDSSLIDDKVLLKADGMPTYHLAVVVDDYLMQITHAFRGEEWLPSAPVHILLWRYLGWEHLMPSWAHLPLILKPDGHGKLSKRDGDRLGFPVFAMDWTDPQSGEVTRGFRERGYLPQAFVNLLALLGWSPGEEREIFTLDELIEKFRLERVHKGGAKFDVEKAKWFNHEWIKHLTAEELKPNVYLFLNAMGLTLPDDSKWLGMIALIKDRCALLEDFYTQLVYLIHEPQQRNLEPVLPKWNQEKVVFFQELSAVWKLTDHGSADILEQQFKQLCDTRNIKPGEVQLPLRIMLVGDKFGPGVFQIAEFLGVKETCKRIENSLTLLPA